MADDGIILYRRGQGFVTWVIVDQDAYESFCIKGGRFETDPHYRKIKNLEKRGN
jgi:hypothetical protein